MSIAYLDTHFSDADPIEGLQFRSTRNPEIQADAWQALVAGQAEDGGLFVPDLAEIKAFNPSVFEEGSELYDLSMSQTSALLLRQFIPSEGKHGIDNTELQEMMDAAHNFDLPLEKLDETTLIAWLSESETASFKDFAARPIAKLLDRYCEKEQTPKNIVVATSGDTGVAIADAFGDSKWVTVTVLYPAGKVSPVQEAQMIAAAEKYPNVQCLPIDGDFDKAQAFSKSMQFMRDLDPKDEGNVAALRDKMSEQLKITLADEVITDLSDKLKELGLASANSINIWRLLPQMTQYFVSYIKAVKSGEIKAGEPIVFSVPTGNVGHLMAGLYARKLGLPVKKFVVGTNDNDIVACALRDFELNHHNISRNEKGENEAKVTESPSMDIADPSNLERLLVTIRGLADPDAELDLEKLKTDTKNFTPGQAGIPLSEYGMTDKMKAYVRDNFYADSISDAEALHMMPIVPQHSDNSTVLEPHGIAGLSAANNAFNAGFIDRDKDKVIVLETAHIDKFPTAFEKAGIVVPDKTHHVLKTLDTQAPENPESVVDSVESVVEKVAQIAWKSAEARKSTVQVIKEDPGAYI